LRCHASFSGIWSSLLFTLPNLSPENRDANLNRRVEDARDTTVPLLLCFCCKLKRERVAGCNMERMRAQILSRSSEDHSVIVLDDSSDDEPRKRRRVLPWRQSSRTRPSAGTDVIELLSTDSDGEGESPALTQGSTSSLLDITRTLRLGGSRVSCSLLCDASTLDVFSGK
jgi:hypothetical protein